MIGRADIVQRVREWGLREDVIEKDYVLGWVLWGVGAHPHLGTHWVFKGGTCIKKCYIETYRFSEDLDFSLLPGGPLQPDDVLAVLREVLPSVSDQSGIDSPFASRAFASARRAYLPRAASITAGRSRHPVWPVSRSTLAAMRR